MFRDQKDLRSNYRRDGQTVLLDLKLKTLAQFFNTFDPSPFYEKDIDPDAEEYIVAAVRELNPRSAVRLVIHLPVGEAAKENAETIEEAIHNYFSYRTDAARRELKLCFREGRQSLAIGLSFLVLCMSFRSLLGFFGHESMMSELISEGLLISGWVAMWRPFQIFLYDWWPIQNKITNMRQLSNIDVQIVPTPEASSGAAEHPVPPPARSILRYP
jgi:hypothetical protein